MNEACFQLFVYGFIFSLKQWAYLKYERVIHYSNDRLFEPEFVFSFVKKKEKKKQL